MKKTKNLFSVFMLMLTSNVMAEDSKSIQDLANLSVEQLINLKVTSVSKKNQKISESPAAVFVITQEDIRRSGVTSIPEALRLAPGVEVARIDGNSWAITARGFNGAFANKLLVLMDGRSVYTPTFSGVFWDSQDTLIEDIDRIEVIRGPGATLWGSNAVNGVINIITKDSSETLGTLVTAGGGSEDRAIVGVRQGGKIGENSSYRLFAKYLERDSFETIGGQKSNDGMDDARAGFRMDSDIDDDEKFTFQGEMAGGDRDLSASIPSFMPPYSTELNSGTSDVLAGNILGRWSKKYSESSDLQIQAYFDHMDRDDRILEHKVQTADFDLQHRFQPAAGHEVIWGAGYRKYWDDIANTPVLTLRDGKRDIELITWFAQDEISIVDKELRLVLGSKFEHTQFTGFEFQPNARMIYQPNNDHTFWGAVSRAVRTPSRLENDARLHYTTTQGPNGLPLSVIGFANMNPSSENLIAYELGYRTNISPKWSFDIATFYNRYTDLLSTEPGQPYPAFDPVPHIVVPYQSQYVNSAQTYGVELVSEYKVMKAWRLVGSYTFLNMNVDLPDNSQDPIAALIEDENPEHQFLLRSLIDLPYNLEFDSAIRYVSELDSIDVEDYFNLDLRLGWKPCKQWEFSVIGQNLLDDSHSEYTGRDFVNFTPTQVQRGVFGKVTWRF